MERTETGASLVTRQLQSRELANLQGNLGTIYSGSQQLGQYDRPESPDSSGDVEPASAIALERIRLSLQNDLHALSEKGAKAKRSAGEASRLERHLTSADRAGLLSLLQSREQLPDQFDQQHLNKRRTTSDLSSVARTGSSARALDIELAARKKLTIKLDEQINALSADLAKRKRASVKHNEDWDAGLDSDRHMAGSLTKAAALPIPKEEWNNAEFAELLADLISEFGQSGSNAGAGDIDAGEGVLRKLQELSVYVHIRDWAESFAIQGPSGMAGTSWQAMRLSLHVFRRVEMPLMPFSTIRRIIGEERGVSRYSLLEHVCRSEGLMHQLAADQALLSQRTRRTEAALESATGNLRGLSDAIAELRTRGSP